MDTDSCHDGYDRKKKPCATEATDDRTQQQEG